MLTGTATPGKTLVTTVRRSREAPAGSAGHPCPPAHWATARRSETACALRRRHDEGGREGCPSCTLVTQRGVLCLTGTTSSDRTPHRSFGAQGGAGEGEPRCHSAAPTWTGYFSSPRYGRLVTPHAPLKFCHSTLGQKEDDGHDHDHDHVHTILTTRSKKHPNQQPPFAERVLCQALCRVSHGRSCVTLAWLLRGPGRVPLDRGGGWGWRALSVSPWAAAICGVDRQGRCPGLWPSSPCYCGSRSIRPYVSARCPGQWLDNP